MTFPEQLHAIIKDPVKEKAVLELIKNECLIEYSHWRGSDILKAQENSMAIASMGTASNLLCRFMGLIKEEK